MHCDDADEDPSTVRHTRDSRGRSPNPSVVRTLGELARELQADPDMGALLEHVVAATVEQIDGARHGGISLVEGQRVRAVAATDVVVEHLDELQNELGDGPCLTSLRDEVTVRLDDLACEDRWPRFIDAAQEAGICSMLSLQLFVEGHNLGALNLYATEAHAFGSGDELIAMAMAAHAAVAMKGSSIESNLRDAVRSRDLIGQAKGILMERYKLDVDEAFRLLVVASQHSHRKLRDIAEELTLTGELDVR